MDPNSCGQLTAFDTTSIEKVKRVETSNVITSYGYIYNQYSSNKLFTIIDSIQLGDNIIVANITNKQSRCLRPLTLLIIIIWQFNFVTDMTSS